MNEHDDNREHHRVLFRIVGTDGGVSVETMWAYDLGDDRYQLDNSPFDVYGVSWQDVVYAPYQEDEGVPTFIRVIETLHVASLGVWLGAVVMAGATAGILFTTMATKTTITMFYM